jgi:hypothetical protein
MRFAFDPVDLSVRNSRFFNKRIPFFAGKQSVEVKIDIKRFDQRKIEKRITAVRAFNFTRYTR